MDRKLGSIHNSCWELFKYIFKEKANHGKSWSQGFLCFCFWFLSWAHLNDISSGVRIGALKTCQDYILFLALEAPTPPPERSSYHLGKWVLHSRAFGVERGGFFVRENLLITLVCEAAEILSSKTFWKTPSLLLPWHGPPWAICSATKSSSNSWGVWVGISEVLDSFWKYLKVV